mmetsp:Transcript_12029/g.23171  ORF Transcript_12029/g.23171 Transcript_12029/m.23171 type:complete len:89 (-) Transcript_12029:655-921(-)
MQSQPDDKKRVRAHPLLGASVPPLSLSLSVISVLSLFSSSSSPIHLSVGLPGETKESGTGRSSTVSAFAGRKYNEKKRASTMVNVPKK